MHFSRVRAADLNLLVLFQALIDERNISRAAAKMNLTQPAMSRALQRLKHMFKDELLVRSKSGYEPTPRAIQIKSELDLLFPNIERLLQPGSFRPELQSGTLRVAATDFGASVILPGFLKMLNEQAPNVDLSITPWNDGTIALLDSGALDLALWFNSCPSHLRSEPLFSEKLICIVNKNHPLANKKMTIKKYLSFSHIAISLKNSNQEAIDQFLDERGLSRTIRVRTPYMTSATFMAQESDSILTVPGRLASRLIPSSKAIAIAAPKELPILNYLQIWHPRVDGDPYSVWIRSLIKLACARISIR